MIKLPSTRLINSFSDKISWKAIIELFPILERIMDLSVRHRSRFKPTIKNFRDPAEWGFARILRRNSNRIDILSMEISDFDTRELLQFRNGPNADHFIPIFRHPYRNRSAPVSISANCPVPGVPQPVAKAFLFYKIGNPALTKRKLEPIPFL